MFHQSSSVSVPPAYAYVMGELGGDLVKVGHSLRPASRLREIRRQMGWPALEILYVCRCLDRGVANIVEWQTHDLLAAHRVEKEWFLVTAEAAAKAVNEVVDSGYVHLLIATRLLARAA